MSFYADFDDWEEVYLEVDGFVLKNRLPLLGRSAEGKKTPPPGPGSEREYLENLIALERSFGEDTTSLQKKLEE